MRRQKYGAVPTTVDGIRFASKREAKRYSELKLMEKAGVIYQLRRQVEYKIKVRSISGVLGVEHDICKYFADFVYWDNEKRAHVIEDVKGYRTPEYKLKKRLAEALYGIRIIEV